jgi:hypothetical protein
MINNLFSFKVIKELNSITKVSTPGKGRIWNNSKKKLIIDPMYSEYKF